MVIEHVAVSWPEAVGQPINCAACNTLHTDAECLSVAYSKEVDGKVQVPMFLICVACIVAQVTPFGRC